MSTEKRPMRQIRKSNPVENIIAFYLDQRSVVLTEEEERLKERYKTAYLFLIEEDSLLDPVTKLMEMFGVCQATAYNYINEAQIVFGNVKKFDKEAWRFIQIERKRKMIARAKEDGNLEVEARLERDIDKLLDFDKDPAKFNPDKFKALQILMTLPRGVKPMLEKMFNKGVVDLNNVEAEDVEFEDLS